MKSLSLRNLSCVLSVLFLLSAAPARAALSDHRFALGVGLIKLEGADGVDVQMGAEYEYLINDFFGIGAFANYVFSDPSITMLGAPQVSVHPLGGDWLLSASPLVVFGSDIDTKVGARFGTRVPIPLGLFMFIPFASVDVIEGGPNYIFGAALQF